MNQLRAIVVDDEEGARDVLSNLLLRFCPEIEVVASCETLEKAVGKIKELQPDVVFLDIEMPRYSGFEIVHFFEEINFEIVFVTAYDHYAVRAFEIAAIDYLLKPIEISRLKRAVSRLGQTNKGQQDQRLDVLNDSLGKDEITNILISDKGQQQLIQLSTLIAIEAQESYCILHTESRQFLASKNLKQFENLLLSTSDFYRVHKSWIINKRHLKNYSRSGLTIQLSNGIVAKLSKYRKMEFEQFIVI
jgi:two-component system, LytTR family, response regulator